MTQRLRAAVDCGALRLVYQPGVDALEHRILRMEALAAAAPNSFAPGTLRIRREVIARFAIAPPPG